MSGVLGTSETTKAIEEMVYQCDQKAFARLYNLTRELNVVLNNPHLPHTKTKEYMICQIINEVFRLSGRKCDPMSTEKRIERLEEKLNEVIGMANEIASEIFQFLGVGIDPVIPINQPEPVEFTEHKTGTKVTT